MCIILVPNFYHIKLIDLESSSSSAEKINWSLSGVVYGYIYHTQWNTYDEIYLIIILRK